MAEKVCTDLGLPAGTTLTGRDIAALDDDALAEAATRATVFARVSPEDKARVVRALRRHGRDVGFLGDGVNDALALHAADIGISVDSATDVAKDAADAVLPWHESGFDLHRKADLRIAGVPLLESDRYFGDPHALTGRLTIPFDLA